jgi:hypothetical protein
MVLERLSAAGVYGGAGYDGLVALEAAAHGRTLLTLDQRAQSTYQQSASPSTQSLRDAVIWRLHPRGGVRHLRLTASRAADYRRTRRVDDEAGRRMTVARGSMRLAILTTALLALLPAVGWAQQPIEPLGAQQRLTESGPPSDPSVDAQNADVAYNSVRNQFLIVWEERTLSEIEIFGRILGADGAPVAGAFRISRTVLPDIPGFESFDPAVAYDPERDRYGVVWAGDDSVDGEMEIFLQVLTGDGALIEPDGDPTTVPVHVSFMGDNTTNFQAAAPDVAYRPDTDGVGNSDAWIVAWSGDDVDDQNEIFTSRIPATLAFSFEFPVSDVGATGGDAFDPSIVVLPGSEDHVVAWEGSTTGTDNEIYARRVTTSGFLRGQTRISVMGGVNDFGADPSITVDSANSQLLVAWRGDDVDTDNEVFVQRLDLGIGQIGADDQQVSSAGPAGSGSLFTVTQPSAVYNPALQRYLVTWIGTDDGRPGLSNDERELMGTVLDAGGTEAAPQDFTISRMGADNDEDATPLDASLAVNTQSKRWLPVWSSDDARGALADNEFEIWGRQVGENFDRDGDGALVPADCDDGNPAIRPGAPDAFDNGIDEDCAGGDAQNPDRDGDGSPRPADCDDANPNIRPGIADVPNNEIDENCDGKKRRTIVDVKVERFFAVFSDFTRVTRLRVTKLRRGMRIQIRCKGKGCPKPLRKGKVRKVKVKKAGSKDFTKLFKRAKLKPRAVIEVRVLQTGAIGRVDRFRIRDGKVPKRVLRCLPPGAKKPRACP